PASALSLSHNLISHSHTLQKNSFCFPACSNPMPSFAPAFDVLTQNALYVHPVFLYFPLTLLHFHSEVSPFQPHPLTLLSAFYILLRNYQPEHKSVLPEFL